MHSDESRRRAQHCTRHCQMRQVPNAPESSEAVLDEIRAYDRHLPHTPSGDGRAIYLEPRTGLPLASHGGKKQQLKTLVRDTIAQRLFRSTARSHNWQAHPSAADGFDSSENAHRWNTPLGQSTQDDTFPRLTGKLLMDSESPLISDRGRLASKLPTQPKQKHAGLGKMTVRSLSHLSTLLPAYHIAALSSFEPFEA